MGCKVQLIYLSEKEEESLGSRGRESLASGHLCVDSRRCLRSTLCPQLSLEKKLSKAEVMIV